MLFCEDKASCTRGVVPCRSSDLNVFIFGRLGALSERVRCHECDASTLEMGFQIDHKCVKITFREVR